MALAREKREGDADAEADTLLKSILDDILTQNV